MMRLCRKFRVIGVAASLFFFVTVFIPGQAKANPMALIPIAAIGTALALGVAGAGSYYAPAVYDAGQLAFDAAGTVGRQIYYGQQFANSVAGNFFYGAACGLKADIGNFLDYLESIADEIPALWQAIQDSWYSGFPAPPTTMPSTGDVMGLPQAQNLGVGPTFTTWLYKFGAYYTQISTCASEGSYLAGYFYWNNYYIKYVTDNGSGANGCMSPNHSVTVRIWNQTSTTDPATEYPPGGFSREGFAQTAPSNDIADDIDKIAGKTDAPPGLITPTATPNPAIAASPSAPAAPAPLTPADLQRGLDAVRAKIAADAAAAVQAAADADPTNTEAQQNAADAARDAAEKAAEAEKPETPSLPSISATSEPAYTLPEVDFAARLETFITNIRSSAIFSVIDNLNLPIGTGISTLSFDFGSWGGVQSLDFADYNSAWLILRGVFFAVFCFIATRIVILKR